MGYQKLNTVDYFPHPVNHGRKMFILRNMYGNDGYIVWFMLLEHLGKSHNHYLNLSDNTQMLYLSAEIDVSQEVFLGVINKLVELEEFDEKLWKEAKIIYSKKFVESVLDAYKRRTNKLQHYSEICLQFLKTSKRNSKNSGNITENSSNIPHTILYDTKDIINTNNIPQIDFVKLLGFFNKTTGKKTRLIPEKIKKQINTRLKEGFTKEDIAAAIKNCFNDDYHKETNHKHLTLEFITRADKLEKYSSIKKQQPVQSNTDHLKRDKF